jgi:hypothetical protein
MKTDRQFVNTLEDIIRERGAPNRLLSDHAILLRRALMLVDGEILDSHGKSDNRVVRVDRGVKAFREGRKETHM